MKSEWDEDATGDKGKGRRIQGRGCSPRLYRPRRRSPPRSRTSPRAPEVSWKRELASTCHTLREHREHCLYWVFSKFGAIFAPMIRLTSQNSVWKRKKDEQFSFGDYISCFESLTEEFSFYNKGKLEFLKETRGILWILQVSSKFDTVERGLM